MFFYMTCLKRLCQATLAGFLVEARQIVACLFHHSHQTVEAHTVSAVGESGVDISIKGTGSRISVALNARNLHKTAHRVARHA